MSTLLDKLTLQARIVKRAGALAVRKDNKINLLYFTYMADTETSDTVIVRFDFENALYYTINGKRTFEKRHILVRGLKPKEVPLSVQGLLSKKNYLIKLRPDAVFIVEVSSGKTVPVISNI